ncbi:hypothetical protein FB45DRAFT_21346 [Roridomyces roridus]|uniref:Oxidase ustYa n=1 Tax=Roridomyces roridus TaxID=1738132 RepID=A0AAD7G2P7_9AGAR|nr:hypothetical protein FB45DRAFT_21346 [Roridomyces roridus]
MTSPRILSALLSAVLISLSLSSILFTYNLFNYVRAAVSQVPLPVGKAYQEPRDPHSYSYVGDDFPLMLPGVPLGDAVRMTVEESVHYSLRPEDRAAWYAAFPDGVGTVRLGSHHRTFFVSMYHELHCLQQFRDILVEPSPKVAWGHLHHCLNYLRERALCQADLTLEPGDFTKRDFSQDRVGATHICRDWTAVISKVDENWNDWVSVWKEFHNVTQLDTSPDSSRLTAVILEPHAISFFGDRKSPSFRGT